MKHDTASKRSPIGSRLNFCGKGGFSMFEVTIVVLIVGIIGAFLIPIVATNLTASRLSTATNVLASDIEFCASECITRPSTPRKIVFDLARNCYTLQDSSGATIKYPADGLPYANDFSTGRNSRLQGVSIKQITANQRELTFDAYGRPQLNADLSIQLQQANATMTVTVKKETGETLITLP